MVTSIAAQQREAEQKKREHLEEEKMVKSYKQRYKLEGACVHYLFVHIPFALVTFLFNFTGAYLFSVSSLSSSRFYIYYRSTVGLVLRIVFSKHTIIKPYYTWWWLEAKEVLFGVSIGWWTTMHMIGKVHVNVFSISYQILNLPFSDISPSIFLMTITTISTILFVSHLSFFQKSTAKRRSVEKVSRCENAGIQGQTETYRARGKLLAWIEGKRTVGRDAEGQEPYEGRIS